jgi:hypothetical protein
MPVITIVAYMAWNLQRCLYGTTGQTKEMVAVNNQLASAPLAGGRQHDRNEHLQEVEECLRMGGYAGPAHGQEWGCVTTFKQ